MRSFLGEAGVVSVLLMTAILGVLLFLFASSTLSFKNQGNSLSRDNLFQSLFPKSFSHAAGADVTIMIDPNVIVSTSKYLPGVSNIDQSLSGSSDPTAVSNVKSLIRNGLTFYNVHLMAWGADDPWPDPNQAEPSNWGSLDQKMQVALDTGTTPILTLCEAPWWMKGQLQANGTTKVLTAADEWADAGYSSRILDNKMDKWLQLVRRSAERYMVAPYNVRYFQVWNELKGYYNPALNNYDSSISAGDPTGNNAKHGYTFMYNKVYDLLRQVAMEKGIDPNLIKIGGPYPVMDTWGETDAGGHPATDPTLFNQAWGTVDNRPLDVVSYWLLNKHGGDFVAVDGSNGLRGGAVSVADGFVSNDKFAAINNWISKQPGGGSIPIVWSEWYIENYPASGGESAWNAVGADALIKQVKSNVMTSLLWGGIEEEAGSPPMWTKTTVGGGQARLFYFSQKIINDYFKSGTPIVKSTSSSQSDVEVLASVAKVMLVNKRNTQTVVDVNGVFVTLNPYEVKVTDMASSQLLGDLNGNKRVDIFDYNTLLFNFGKSGVGYAGGDIDNSGKVGILDYNQLLFNFGKSIP